MSVVRPKVHFKDNCKSILKTGNKLFCTTGMIRWKIVLNGGRWLKLFRINWTSQGKENMNVPENGGKDRIYFVSIMLDHESHIYECKITITVRTWYLSVSTASKRVISLARTTPVLRNRWVIIDVSRNLHILL